MLMYDLSTAFVAPPETASAGESLTLTVEAASTFDREITCTYRWRIDGLEEESLEFLDGGMEDRITFAPMEAKQLSISFTMPKNDVHIVFELNPADGSGNREIMENGNYDNNIAAHLLELDNTLPLPDNIPPWVLTKELSFYVSSSATLSKPRGQWSSSASGSLDIENGSVDIYNDFEVHNNPPVNEWPPNIYRNPQITATLKRADFGDDPQNRYFAPNNIPLSKTGVVSGSGAVEADYKWTVTTRDPGPPPTTEREAFYASASAGFSPINDERAYAFDVYNGLEKLRRKSFDKYAQKSREKFKFELAWEGTPYPFGEGWGD
jgi:hypothetical protein